MDGKAGKGGRGIGVCGQILCQQLAPPGLKVEGKLADCARWPGGGELEVGDLSSLFNCHY